MKKILILPSVFLSLVSCKEEREAENIRESALEQQAMALEAQLSKIQRRLLEEENVRLKQSIEQTALLSEVKELLKERMDSSKTKPVMMSEAEKLTHDSLEARRLARLEAKGEKHAALTTVSGVAYRDLVISRITDIGVIFRHEGGLARVPFTDLSAAWQERFYYDEALALRAQEAETLAKLLRESAAKTRAEEIEQQMKKKPEQAVKVALEDQIIVAPPLIHSAHFVNGGNSCSLRKSSHVRVSKSSHARVSKSPHVRTSNRTFFGLGHSGFRSSSFSRGRSSFRSSNFRGSSRSRSVSRPRQIRTIRR